MKKTCVNSWITLPRALPNGCDSMRVVVQELHHRKTPQPFPSNLTEKRNEPAESGPNGSHTDDKVVVKSLVTVRVCVRYIKNG